MKHVFHCLVVAILALGFIASVGAGGAQEADDVTRVSFWHFPQVRQVPGYEDITEEHGQWWAYLAEQFNEQNPGVEIETEMLAWEGGVDRINTAIAGGNPPDMVFDYLGRTGGWYAQGAVTPVDDLVSQETQDDLLESFRDLYLIDGNLHGVPVFSWSIVLPINIGLLRDIGIEGEILNGPGEPYSHEEFEELLREIRDKAPADVHPLGMAAGSEQGDYNWWQFFWGFGGRLFDNGSFTSDSSGIIDGFEYLKSLDDQDLFAPGVASYTLADISSMYAAGRIAALGGHAVRESQIEEAISQGLVDYELNVQPFPFPTRDGESAFSAVGPTGLVVLSNNPERQRIAGEFIDFVMEAEHHAGTVGGAGQFPTTHSVTNMNLYEGEGFNEILAQMTERYPAGDFGIAHPNYNEIRTFLAQAAQAIFTEASSIDDAVDELLERWHSLE